MTHPFRIIHHECNRDLDDYRVIGPFDSRSEAEAYIERHGLRIPSGAGGYAVAVVVPNAADYTPQEYRTED